MAKQKITKDQLRKYISDLIVKKREAVENSIAQKVEQQALPVIREVIGDVLKKVEQATNHYIKILDEIPESLPSLFGYGIPNKSPHYWNVYHTKNHAKQLNNIHAAVESYIIEKIKGYIRYPQSSAVNFDIDALNDVTSSLIEQTNEEREKLKNLNTLYAELTTIVDTERNGKSAYKALIALGVDMSGFEAKEQVALVVTKLSVDPSILKEGQ